MAVPKLRFKEFDADYTNTTFEKLKGFSIQSGKSEEKGDTGEFPFYGSTGVIGYKDIFDYEGKSILIARVGANAGSLYQIDGKYSVSDNTLRLTVSDDTSLDYLRELLIKFNLNRLVFGTGQPLVTGGMIKKVNIFIPEFTEQTKIASFLSAVDEKISQLTQKHQLLSQYKQGMMQKLFSQQLRFKADDGCEFGAWKHCKLKDVLISYRLGGNYSNAEMVTSYPLIKMGNLGRGSINLDKIEYIPEDQIIDPEDLIKKNDLFFNTRNTLDLVGKVALWRGELPIAYYNSNLLRLDFENNIFMNYLFNEQKTLEKLKAIASGTTSVAAIYTKDLLKINLEIPCLEEQNKIASFLSSIDQKIEVVAQQIEQAKTWKKGLLQQMFV